MLMWLPSIIESQTGLLLATLRYVISRTFQFPGLLLDQKELEELERYSRNANHHDHGHHHEHGHEASEDIFDRAARVGIRVFDGKDREGADDLGNDLELIGGVYDTI